MIIFHITVNRNLGLANGVKVLAKIRRLRPDQNNRYLILMGITSDEYT